jgi:hypothetical protein
LIWPPRLARKFPTPVQEAMQNAVAPAGDLSKFRQHRPVMKLAPGTERRLRVVDPISV